MPADLPMQGFISQAVQGSTEYQVDTIKYGNGYSQRARKGLNANTSTWSLTFENLYESEFDTLVAAFDAAYGVDYFRWTPKGDGSQKKFIVPKFTRTVAAGGLYSVTATLEQVFDL